MINIGFNPDSAVEFSIEKGNVEPFRREVDGLARLRGFAGFKGYKWLKKQPVGPKGLHYRAVVEAA
jgi:hypothetical protein